MFFNKYKNKLNYFIIIIIYNIPFYSLNIYYFILYINIKLVILIKN